MSSVTLDYNGLIVTGGGIIVTLIVTIGPLYFKLLSETRANKDAREAAALAVAAASAAASAAAASAGDLVLKFDTMSGRLDGKLDKIVQLAAEKARLEGIAEGKATERQNPMVPLAVQHQADQMLVVAAIDTNTKETVKATKNVADLIKDIK